ncbi:hypothetical protein C1752_08946 [Acaryochloris thomasi RCC1774]|uniref:DUF6788 domain-containing protein n=2 Tax=Acaryochloris TaxID=155977 RepID=A0A2W1JKT0_9CYAN|nr:hypothetical protein C1752_08946 [Acaryochloris thomasi RCC1774]
MECERGKEVDRDEHGKPLDQEGHIEKRMVNGCGPYKYLRWWEGGKHRAVYLGKADDEKRSV